MYESFYLIGFNFLVSAELSLSVTQNCLWVSQWSCFLFLFVCSWLFFPCFTSGCCCLSVRRLQFWSKKHVFFITVSVVRAVFQSCDPESVSRASPYSQSCLHSTFTASCLSRIFPLYLIWPTFALYQPTVGSDLWFESEWFITLHHSNSTEGPS